MTSLPGRPKTKRGAVLAIGGSIVVLVSVAFALVYFVIFPTSSPKRFSLIQRRRQHAEERQIDAR